MASAAEQLAANMNMGSFAKATELHKRLLFTLGALLVYRIGTYVPIPGINSQAFLQFFQNPDGQRGILDMFNMFSGGAVERMAIFALNVMPYISASIIVQLMGTVYPPWEKLKKEGGESGRKQLNQYTRYLTVFLALAQSFGIAAGLNSTAGLVDNPGIFFIISTVVTLTGGTMFLMWLGEQVTARGVGNGISLIIFAGIVAVLPSTIARLLGLAQQGQMSAFALLFIAILAVATVVFIVFMERAQRRLLIQYPKRQEGNRMAGGERSFLPLKVNTAGVIPPIFASSLLMLPTTVATMTANADLPSWMSWLPLVTAQLTHGQPLFMALYAALIVFFCFFYTSITFNPEDTSGQAHGGISGLCPDPPDRDRRRLHHRGLPAAGVHRQPVRQQPVLWRNVYLDRRLGHHGHCGPDPVPTAGAPVRRPDQEGQAAWSWRSRRSHARSPLSLRLSDAQGRAEA